MSEERWAFLGIILLPTIAAVVGNAIWGAPDGAATGVGVLILVGLVVFVGAVLVGEAVKAIKARSP